MSRTTGTESGTEKGNDGRICEENEIEVHFIAKRKTSTGERMFNVCVLVG